MLVVFVVFGVITCVGKQRYCMNPSAVIVVGVTNPCRPTNGVLAVYTYTFLLSVDLRVPLLNVKLLLVTAEKNVGPLLSYPTINCWKKTVVLGRFQY
jgi:hypothetical protein